MKKILYLSSKAGGGHTAALRAIKQAIAELKGEAAFAHRETDIWEIGGAVQNRLFGAKSYSFILKYLPALNRALFNFFNIKTVADIAFRINYPNVGKSLRRIIKEERPDIMVSVHPLANPLAVATLRDLGLLGKIPTVNVVTELLRIHRFWAEPGFDLTIVPTPEARMQCIGYGCDPGKIKLIGIPVDPRLLKSADRAGIRQEIGLDPAKFTILIMGGAEGFGRIFEQTRALNRLAKDFQVTVIAGRNRALFRRLEKEGKSFKFPLKLYAFTGEVPKLMQASDLLISKAGPQTVAEAMAAELPLIAASYIPGQEDPMPEWIEKTGIGRYVPDPEKLPETVAEIKTEEIKNNIRRVKNPRVTYEVAESILSLIP